MPQTEVLPEDEELTFEENEVTQPDSSNIIRNLEDRLAYQVSNSNRKLCLYASMSHLLRPNCLNAANGFTGDSRLVAEKISQLCIIFSA